MPKKYSKWSIMFITMILGYCTTEDELESSKTQSERRSNDESPRSFLPQFSSQIETNNRFSKSSERENSRVSSVGFPAHPFLTGIGVDASSNKQEARGQKFISPHFSSEIENESPLWLVVGSQRVIPGAVFRVVVQSQAKQGSGGRGSLEVYASLTSNGRLVSKADVISEPGQVHVILLKVPLRSVSGTWELHLKGLQATTKRKIFQERKQLYFDPNFLTILIQTSRPVYNAGQTVLFRVVLLNREMKAFEDPVSIFIKDPVHQIMKRWPSRHSGGGVINLSFDLPSYPLTGNWTIEIESNEQIQTKTFLVEHYFRPRFEVFVRLQSAFKMTNDNHIEGVVVANMTNWRNVHGNCSIELQEPMDNSFPVPTKYKVISRQFFHNFTGVQPFRFAIEPNSTLRSVQNDEMILRVESLVGDSFGWQIQKGWALTRIIRDRIKLSFLGDQPVFFVPGMPLEVKLLPLYTDDHPLEKEELQEANLVVSFRSSGQTMKVSLNGTILLENDGLATAFFTPSEKADAIKINARIETSSGMTAQTSVEALRQHSSGDHYIQIQTSTPDAVPGENLVFHVRNNFRITHFYYLVVSNGMILHSDRKNVADFNIPTITTFVLPASVEMGPVASILIWAVDKNENIISHSIYVPVNPLENHQVNVNWNEHKDHTGGSSEVKMIGEKGSFFATSAIWEETFLMDAAHNLDEARVLEELYNSHHDSIGLVDNTTFPIPNPGRILRRSRYGKGTELKFLSSPNNGPNAFMTFWLNGVFVLSNAFPNVLTEGQPARTNIKIRRHICLTGGHHELHKRCDGVIDCADASDEMGCQVNADALRQFRLHRTNRIFRFYDPDDGDWGWKDIRREGREILVFPFPKRPQNWVFSMYAVGTEKGLGVMKKNIQFDSAGPFVLTVEAPRVARMWEQVGITIGIFNFHSLTVAVYVTLVPSPDYKSIQVEKHGIVDSYNPRKMDGKWEHLVWLPASSSTDIHIPIVFTRMGSIEVKVKGSTQMQKDSHSAIIEVLPEGALINKHTSIIMDLKDKALVYEFLDIHLEESPIIPYKLQRHYIYGTPQGHISVTGDILGPITPKIPSGPFREMGSGAMGAETAAFNFAANVWNLHYLRLTNQVTSQMLYKSLTEVNVEYVAVCRYQSENGGFSNWMDSESSTWLTAYILKSLMVASFQDWENLIYIDPAVIQSGVSFLLQKQTSNGSFSETQAYINPLDSKMDPRTHHDRSPKYRNVTLTAYVVLCLCEVMTTIREPHLKDATNAKQKAVKYLEQQLAILDDPYALALVTWALIKAKSQEKDFAFQSLDAIKRVSGDRIYWSREPIGFNIRINQDNQKPYLQPKDDQKWDAHAVETTAYALLTYLKRYGVGIITENIMRFLVSMKEQDGGFISTVDSLVAFQALIEYSNRARIRDITDMKISVEQSATNSEMKICLDNSRNLSTTKYMELSHIFGHLNIIAKGSGQALFQLDYTFGVDVPSLLDVPPVPSFEFTVQAHYRGRNSSYMSITSCQRWINVQERENSGLTVVDIHLPTGYYIMQDDLIDIVRSRKVKQLRWALRTDRQVQFFFNRLDSDTLCFSYQLERWYPVSNHSRHNLAIVYELFQPERFQMYLFEVFSLYALDICEVCGSYQCPYCPFYSGADIPNLSTSILLISEYSILIIWRNIR